MRVRALAASLTLVLALGTAVHADEPGPTCAAETVDRFQYLRRLSLDLRQRPPGLDEYEALLTQPDLPDTTIDALLADADFSVLLRAYHDELLWPALEENRLFSSMTRLSTAPGATPRLFIEQDSRSFVYRGAPSGRTCADRRQTSFDADGLPRPGSDGLDGWVDVEPYWAPGKTVRVCAHEAQARLVVPAALAGTAHDVACSLPTSLPDPHCGCGPHLNFCSTEASQAAVHDAFLEQARRFILDVGRGERPYTDLLLGRDAEVNGPLAHYLHWQWAFAHDEDLSPEPGVDVPALPWTDARWQSVLRGERHAGILTMPLYLMRFPTNRSRANRLLGTLLCAPLEPPPGGLRLDPTDEPDVAKRPGCSYCHQVLEPAAAHWARFAEQGAAWLDPTAYPVESPVCRDRAWLDDPVAKAMCKRRYIIEREPHGILRPFEFARDGSPDALRLAQNAEAGPRALAQASIDDGRFASCTARRWWSYLMRRAPTDAEVRQELPLLAARFRDDGYRLPKLIRRIVMHPAYRAVRVDAAPK